MKTRLVRIGNSRGIRLPELLIEQAGLEEVIELEVRGNSIVLRPVSTPRAGWAEAAVQVARSEVRPLDVVHTTLFDQQEWRW